MDIEDNKVQLLVVSLWNSDVEKIIWVAKKKKPIDVKYLDPF